MKNTVLLLICIFFLGEASAQFDDGDIIISGSRARLFYGDFNSFNDVSADIQYFVHDNVSLNYSIAINGNYFHVPASIPIVAVALYCGVTADVEFLYLLLIPEGVSYHIPINESFGFSPYINPLGFEYMEYPEGGNAWYMTGAAGIRFNALLYDRFYISPFTEYKVNYANSDYGLRTGVSAGYRFY